MAGCKEHFLFYDEGIQGCIRVYIKCACSADLIATMEAPVGKSPDPRKGVGLRYIFSRALS